MIEQPFDPTPGTQECGESAPNCAPSRAGTRGTPPTEHTKAMTDKRTYRTAQPHCAVCNKPVPIAVAFRGVMRCPKHTMQALEQEGLSLDDALHK